ncbi:MAG: hypothetical protein FJ288_20140 [Planctomycetes bacterium]|nr:hypothetical protein [Planctomycetota bacterium]
MRQHLRWHERLGFRLFLEQIRHMKVGTLDLWTGLADRVIRAWQIPTYAPGSRYAGRALAERGADGLPPRFVVYGHTHRVESVPLGPLGRDGADRFYLNTGTGRPVGELARTADGSTHFASWKEMSYVVIYATNEGGRAQDFEVRSGSLRDRPGAPAPASEDVGRQRGNPVKTACRVRASP